MNLLELPRDILRILLSDGDVAFVLCRMNKQLRDLLSNEDWYLLFIAKFFKEEYNKDSNYRQRFVRLKNNPISDYTNAVHSDQIRYLHESKILTRSHLLNGDRNGRSSLHDTIDKMMKKRRLGVIRSLIDITRDFSQLSISRCYKSIIEPSCDNTRDSSNESSQFSIDDQVEMIQYLVLNSDNLEQEWIWEVIEPFLKYLPYSFFKKLILEVGPINEIDSHFIGILTQLSQSNSIDLLDLLLSSCMEKIGSLDQNFDEENFRVEGHIIEIFRKHGHNIYSDEDIDDFLDGSPYTQVIEKLLDECIESTTMIIVNDLSSKYPEEKGRWSKDILLRSLRSDNCTISYLDSLMMCGIDFKMLIPDPFPQEDVVEGQDIEKITCVSVGMLKYLIDMGLDIANKKYVKLLDHSRDEMLELLLNIGLGNFYEESKKRELLSKFIYENNHRSISILLSNGYPVAIDSLHRYLKSRYNWITEERNYEAIARNVRLMANKENVSFHDTFSSTIYWAMKLGNKEILSIIVEMGVDLSDTCSQNNVYPLEVALESRNRELISFTVEELEKKAANTLKIEEFVVSNYFRVFTSICIGKSRLGNHEEILKLLLLSDGESDPTRLHRQLLLIYIATYQGNINDMFSLAIANQNRYAMEMIMRMFDIDINGRNSNGLYHIHLAIHKVGDISRSQLNAGLDVYQYLIKAGANINVVDSNGNSSLMIAVNSKAYPAMLIMAPLMDDIYRENGDGLTPMKLAIYNQDTHAIKTLLRCKYDIHSDEHRSLEGIKEFVEQYGTKKIAKMLGL